MKKLLCGTILLAMLIAFPIMSMGQVNVQVNVPVPLPPPIPFIGPPNVVILPGTAVYAVPDVKEELFFRNGTWWRHHDGHWFRSKHHDHGWAYYRGNPSWHKQIPRNWRDRYRDHRWGGHPWNPRHITHGNLNNHWRGGHWRNDHGWGRPGGGKGRGKGGDGLHGGGKGGKGGRTHPDGRMNRSDRGDSHRGDRR